jgi:hypothetical protein
MRRHLLSLDKAMKIYSDTTVDLQTEPLVL